MQFLLKLETSSSPVKGVSFHHRRPWILASLENGTIQLWDYEQSLLLRQYQGHDGPVRGVSFSRLRPIFVSGGDDRNLKIWNFESKECTAILPGHRGIITSCFFHQIFPWIISSSNDGAIKIWDSRTYRCFSELVGHKMAVTCVKFHATGGAAISSSADGTVRLWDISKLVREQKLPKTEMRAENLEPIVFHHAFSLGFHTKGVNCVSYHDKMPIVISGSDDKTIIQCTYWPDWEVAFKEKQYEGCFDGSVNSVVSHPNSDLIIGCSDDKSIRIWSSSNYKCVDILRYQSKTFSVLAVHPSLSLVAAGHEDGMIIFKHMKERPVYQATKYATTYIYKNELRSIVFKDNKCIIGCVDKIPYEYDEYLERRDSLSFNSADSYFLLTSTTKDRETCHFELLKIKAKIDENSEFRRVRIPGRRAFWSWKSSNTFFVFLNEEQKVELRDLSNKTVKQLKDVVDDIFYFGAGKILLKKGNKYEVFDIVKAIVSATVELHDDVHHVILSNSGEYFAFLSKKKVLLLNQKLEILCIQQESNNVKAGCWIGESVFVYNTGYEIKYLIITGDFGIIKALDKRLYVFAAEGSTLYCFDRDANIVEVPFESMEYEIKLALSNGKIDEALHLLKSKRVKFVSMPILEGLAKFGYLEVALNNAKVEKTRFMLSMKYGTLEKALESAERLDESYAWEELTNAALVEGNHRILEICYKKTNNHGKLIFLYLVTGNIEKLKEQMRKINDLNAQFQIVLLIGDIGERIGILRECGQTSLAYLTAATHGYDDEAKELRYELESEKLQLPMIDSTAKLLAPPLPVYRMIENWPGIKFENNSHSNDDEAVELKNAVYLGTTINRKGTRGKFEESR